MWNNVYDDAKDFQVSKYSKAYKSKYLENEACFIRLIHLLSINGYNMT